jgi:Skp family chaperone for outer membrane proteins
MMRFARTIFVLAFALALWTSVHAQAPVQTTGAKVGFVNTEKFSDQTAGVTKLVNAMRSLDVEFKARRDEINSMVVRLNTLQQAPSAGTTAAQAAQRREQAETLSVEIRRRQEDARAAFTRRHAALTEPIRLSIFTALEAYAKQRGIDVLVDVAKFPDGILIVNQTVDLTPGFIRDFNSKNP